jgi:hypothetical protein
MGLSRARVVPSKSSCYLLLMDSRSLGDLSDADVVAVFPFIIWSSRSANAGDRDESSVITAAMAETD